ncbi:HAD-IIA family hydrolase [Corynebacterium cystitidis]|uniref:Haloacid Dehalogenase Superfamily Class (Subfamily) IIA n=1 Tax=Corynebacterium cystitidis DSM 20524 TaxID=1121357 RepID=A0A1H9PXJ9_9CORY|nr:HAD-IIA family hydrolase [Corynebacterium cystitidis]WJY82345.1 putative hydrolase YutF [Corynebacterium cystitidis DSM 20524]SER52848.1 Haloacid Dehalogenase Superfamily Class (subfamily) IIA [Corynebacterium cystitidis DSM 20524]SNV76326.1 predicted sugar phosphatase of the HAD superfamily [Corynebacterium cystitidis]
MTLAEKYDSLLLDLDGTVWAGGEAIPGAVDAITSSGLPTAYVTNNASRGPAAVAEKLRAIGLEVMDTDVVTSAQAAITMAREYLNPGDPVLVVGAPSFKELVTEAGYKVVDSADDHPKVVLHGHNPETGWVQLSEAALSIRQGATYLASNLDTTLPMERGLHVGNGSMVAAVTSATGVMPASAGKPEPAMFHQAAQALNSTAPLAVGDRLDTDIAGAVAAKMDSLHVLTGVSGPLALIEATPEQRPRYIAEDMSALHQDPSMLVPGPQGGFTARVDGDDVLLERGNPGATSIEALRTVLNVAWSMPEAPAFIRPMSDAADAATAQWW